MILAVDIGNTNVVLGCIEGEKILFLERMATDRGATDMEYLVRIRSVLKFRDIDPEKLEGAMDQIRKKYGNSAILFGAAKQEKEEDPLP